MDLWIRNAPAEKYQETKMMAIAGICRLPFERQAFVPPRSDLTREELVDMPRRCIALGCNTKPGAKSKTRPTERVERMLPYCDILRIGIWKEEGLVRKIHQEGNVKHLMHHIHISSTRPCKCHLAMSKS